MTEDPAVNQALQTAAEPDVSCVVLLDKPAGPTSFAMVRAARRGLRARVGHAGTLDPFATGLLLILVGRATRASNLLMGLPKEYEFTVQFGATSTTADPTGEIVPTGRETEAARLVEVLDAFRGRIRQKVPLTSAVKVAGEPLYKKAHRGETVETPEREVVVHDLRLLDFDQETQRAQLVAVTGSGTYVRSLVEDLGRATGAGAYAASLRRTRCGRFSVDEALPPEELSPARYAAGGRGVVPVGEALDFLPAHRLDARQMRAAAHGHPFPDGPTGRFRVYGRDGLLGVYEGQGDMARPLLVFPRPL